MDNYSRGLVTTARAGVKRGVVVYLSALEQQNLVIQLVNFKGQSQLGKYSGGSEIRPLENRTI